MFPYPFQRGKEINLETVNVILFIVLIILTAFFVATEFAVIRVRSTRIDQLIEEGNRNALAAKKVVSNLDGYLSATQLGITVTALGLGWIGEPTVGHLLEPLIDMLPFAASLSHVISFVLAFSVVTFLNVVAGELAPKTVAIQKAEQVTLLFSRPLILFSKLLYPFIWLLNHSARGVVGLFGLKPASENEVAHSEEELRIILSESYESGEINQSEFKFMNNIFEFDNRTAKEIMVPRTEIVSVSADETIEEFLKMARVEQYTRYPVVVDGNKDQVVGLVNIKEILADYIKEDDIKPRTVQTYMKPIIQVIDSIAIYDLLLKIQKDRIHMAILIDEYGGTTGLVTVEDILEEIVGEIRDEFDDDEIPDVHKINENHYVLDAKVLIEEVNDLLGTNIEQEDVDTIGGWMLTEKFDLAKGDSITNESFSFKVIDIEHHHIKRLEITKEKSTDNS